MSATAATKVLAICCSTFDIGFEYWCQCFSCAYDFFLDSKGSCHFRRMTRDQFQLEKQLIGSLAPTDKPINIVQPIHRSPSQLVDVFGPNLPGKQGRWKPGLPPSFIANHVVEADEVGWVTAVLSLVTSSALVRPR
ncbi:hypothetical protein FHT78_004151 [Rhizobium sp. BK196]|jgi:hypothetical protein|nr:hypothetical protein [Rhizobium sp. BK196]MBB3463178.1 hypothetical protein [Rhizobium sp. BK377]